MPERLRPHKYLRSGDHLPSSLVAEDMDECCNAYSRHDQVYSWGEQTDVHCFYGSVITPARNGDIECDV